MFHQRVTDSRCLFGGEYSPDYEDKMLNLIGDDPAIADYEIEYILQEPLAVGWVALDQLKRHSGGYIMGGGADHCLREVELLMSAINAKAKRVSALVY
jgi:hypothetical protein